MNQPTDTPPPPEAVLIRRARGALSLSPEKAVPLLPPGVIRASQWRNIEAGKSYAKDDVLAHMANVVEVTPEELEGVNRVEAAHILRRIRREAGRETSDAVDKAHLEAWERLQALLARNRDDPERLRQAERLIRAAWNDKAG